MKTNTVNNVDYVSAVLAAIFAIIYSVFQLLAVFRVVAHPYELFWMFLPSLLLAPCFLITIISLHYRADEEHKIYTAIASAFAILYCAMVSMVYFTQLALVIPALLNKEINETHVLAFNGRSFMVSVDCIAYAFMNTSTLFAAFAFHGHEDKRVYRFLLLNGLQVPIVVLALFSTVFLFIGALWMITLPAAMIMVAKMFKTNKQPSIMS